MVVPFALAVGVAMALGIAGAPILWALAAAAAGAALYMWNTRAARPAGPPIRALMTYAGLLLLMSLLGGAGYFLGRLFGWARLDA